MSDVGGQTHQVLDRRAKRRQDCTIDDPALLRPLRKALDERVRPEVEKAFGYRFTQVERYIIGCYDGSDRGFFQSHRDNTAKGTAHRKFALSLNLNSDEYEGGALRFPEYGAHLYKPAAGPRSYSRARCCTRRHQSRVADAMRSCRSSTTTWARRAENQRFVRKEGRATLTGNPIA